MITNRAQGTDFTTTRVNPFPGLRSFGVEESHLFFGRGGQSEIILEYLAENRFAAVTGASGSGKSSLIYCGLIPILYGGFIAGTGSSWRIIATRPGNKPVRNLADALVESESKHIGKVFEEQRSELVYSLLRRSSYGLVDAATQMGLDDDENLLLIIDQFEELFRFKDSRVDTITTLNETEAFIKLLVNAAQQRKKSIYVVLTMRSDFIGECSDFQELTKLINNSNYLVPQMTRQDFRQAILGPLAIAGVDVDPQLVQHILNSIGERTDQLPVLQHAMMRTWEFWRRYNEPGTSISMRDYEAAGKLENALSMHANEAFEELTDEGKRICKGMFKILTEKGADNKGIRHPATIDEIAIITNSQIEDVQDVVDKFRIRGRSFLTPQENNILEEDTVVDISHESLMRVWDKLIDWVEEESSSVQMYLRLSEAASLYQLGKTGLWRPPDLHLAVNWKKTQNPSLQWAKKYNPAFEKVMVFLDASEKKHNQEEQNKVKLQRRTLNRTRRFAVSMGGAALLLIFMSFFIYKQYLEVQDLRVIAEERADVAEFRAEDAEQDYQEETIRRLQAQAAKDSIEKESLLQLLQMEEVTQEAYNRIEELDDYSEELERTTEQAQTQSEEDRLRAEQARIQADRAELQKQNELKKRMLSLAQSMSVKSLTVENKDLKGLLTLQAFRFNKQYEGINNHPDIYTGLYGAMRSLRGNEYNARAGHEGNVRSIVFVPRQNVFYSTGDGKILKWNLQGNARSGQLLIKNDYMNRSLDVSSDGKWLACGSSKSTIQLFNLSKPGQEPKILEAHLGGNWSVAFVPGKNQLVSTGGDKKIYVWNLSNYNRKELVVNDQRIRSLVIAPNGSSILGVTDDGKLKRWNINSGSSEVLYSNSSGAIYTISINRSGTRVAMGDKAGNVIVFNPTNKSLITKYKAHTGRILDLKYNPAGTQLASSSLDGTIKIWNTRNFKERPVIIKEQESWVMALAFSSNGKNLVSSSKNQDKLYIWPSNTQNMANEICTYISRNMTRQEWETYVGFDINYQKSCQGKN